MLVKKAIHCVLQPDTSPEVTQAGWLCLSHPIVCWRQFMLIGITATLVFAFMRNWVQVGSLFARNSIILTSEGKCEYLPKSYLVCIHQFNISWLKKRLRSLNSEYKGNKIFWWYTSFYHWHSGLSNQIWWVIVCYFNPFDHRCIEAVVLLSLICWHSLLLFHLKSKYCFATFDKCFGIYCRCQQDSNPVM